MKLNTIGPAAGSKKPRLRVGRGASAGQGKTCGRGVKGQRARKGGYHKVGFEGGQMPLQRRLPKVGFRSAIARRVAEVRLSELHKVEGGNVSLESLKVANLVPADTLRAKLVLSGECRLLVDGEERPLRQWDFFHSPPWTEHGFVGAGDGPCAILMAGARLGPEVRYPVSELAARYGACVAEETSDPEQAYANAEWFRRQRPPHWKRLPWA